MNDLKVLIGRGDTFWDISELVEKVVWGGRKGSPTRTCTITILNSETVDTVKSDCSDGITVILYENSEELFRGLLMKENVASKRTKTLSCYDNGIYLSNNKYSITFKKKRADQITKECLSKVGLKVDSLANTGHKIGEMAKTRSTLWDMIQDALSQTFSSTGKRYWLRFSKGKAKLFLRADPKEAIKLTPNSNTEGYEFTRSIYDTRTRISLTTSKGTEKKSYKNEALEKKIGVFRDMDAVDDKVTSTELLNKINSFKKNKAVVSKGLSWNGTGDSAVMAGGCVYVDIAEIGTNQMMYVDEDTHTWEKGSHTMKLTLSYVNS